MNKKNKRYTVRQGRRLTFANKLLLVTATITILCLLLAFFFGYSLWQPHWLIDFLLMFMPILLMLCIIFTVIFGIQRRWNWLIICIGILAMGYPFLKRTYGFHVQPNQTAHGLTVLSYNLMWLQADNYATDKVSAIEAQKAWINNFDADIKCFQEFYHDPKTITYNTLRAIKLPHKYLLKPTHDPHLVGVATFSRFPIVYTEQLSFPEIEGNGALLTDLKIGKDTLRVLNIHLQSMGIRVNKVFRSNSFAQATTELKRIFVRLKFGFSQRRKQVKRIEKWVIQSPYSVLLCGDFNETPFGFAYGTISKHLANSFEEKGLGFGFSYNRSPTFIRIDNQFFSTNGMAITSFKTYKDIKFSDHYPIMGNYILLK